MNDTTDAVQMKSPPRFILWLAIMLIHIACWMLKFLMRVAR